MRWSIPLALAVTFAAVGTVSAQTRGELRLNPEWPEDFQQARSEPIRLLPGPPVAEDRSHAPLVPGSSTAGTQHAFELVLENPDGSLGPAGDLDLDPSRPIVLDVYAGAGPSDDDGPAATPVDDGSGAAPSLTIEAQVHVGDRTTARQNLTATIVSTPTEDDVTRYRFTFDVTQELLRAGSGLSVDLSVHQVDRGDQRATQPQWRIHTDTDHPTGLTVPLSVTTPADGDRTSFAIEEASAGSREPVQTGAYGALVAAIAAAGWATRRGYRQLRED